MEPNRERQALEELERQLLRDDPAFVHRIRTEAVPPRSFPAWLTLGASVYILIPVAMLLAGWAGVLAVIGAALVTAAIRRLRAGRRNRGRDGSAS
jgi:hypothetical protein